MLCFVALCGARKKSITWWQRPRLELTLVSITPQVDEKLESNAPVNTPWTNNGQWGMRRHAQGGHAWAECLLDKQENRSRSVIGNLYQTNLINEARRGSYVPKISIHESQMLFSLYITCTWLTWLVVYVCALLNIKELAIHEGIHITHSLSCQSFRYNHVRKWELIVFWKNIMLIIMQ